MGKEDILSLTKQVVWMIIGIIVLFLGLLIVFSFAWYGICGIAGTSFEATVPLGLTFGSLVVMGGNAIIKIVS